MGLSMIVIIYILVNAYLSYKLQLVLDIQSSFNRTCFYIAYFFITLSYIFARFFAQIYTGTFADILTMIGGYAIANTYYAALLVFSYKILKFIIGYIHPQLNNINAYTELKLLIAVLLLINIYGQYNAAHPAVTTYNIHTDKQLPGGKLKIVAISDMHLGKITSPQFARQIVTDINSQQADIVFLIGDIIDSDLESIERKNLLADFNNIRSKYGVYAVFGNHEYIDRQPNHVKRLLTAQNINVLIDQSTIVADNSLLLVGLKDIGRANPAADQSLAKLITPDSTKYFSIVLDHQPKRIKAAEEHKVNLIISGHTHRGQYFPNNYITQMMYLNDWGLKKFSDTISIVTCGYGNWGSHMRIGSKPELVVIEISNS